MSKTFDVVIIGAGIMGCSTAFELSKQGVKVAVLEKGSLGAGSTGKSSAIIRTHYSNEVTARMALHSLGVFRHFKDQVGDVCGFEETGFLVLTPAKDAEGLRANVEFQRGVGIETELLSQEQIRELWPMFEAGDLVAAAFESKSGYADPNLALNGLAKAARQHGARIHQETEVTGIRLSGGNILGVETPKGSFEAPVVVNCAGPWGAQVASLAGVKVPINSCRVQVGLFRRPAGYEAVHPVVADFVNGVYWRSETGRLTLVGLIDSGEEKAVVDPDAYNERIDIAFAADSGERLVRRFPAMEQSEGAGGFAALYAITPDWHPVIDELLPGSGLFVCSGFSGHGFKLGPAVGLMTADMIMGRDTPGMDRGMFRLSRFAEGELVRGRYDYSIVG